MTDTAVAPVGVVTGAGSGIGRATVARLRELGARVDAWDWDASIADRFPGDPHVRTRVVDVTDHRRVVEAAAEAREESGRIDFVVNCAGSFLVGPLAEVTKPKIQKLFELNVIGPTLVTQALLPALRDSRGAVVNVASTVGIKASASNSHYAASKAAVVQLTRCWAIELGPDGIRVNAVAPGPMKTAIYQNAGMTAVQEDDLLGTRAAAVPLRRTGHPEEAAAWIARLCLEDNWTTGAVIPVDGGMSL